MILILLAVVLSHTYYTPEEAQAIFNQAGDAYYREDYAAAKEGYLKLLSHGFGGPDVLYNLGTTCLSQGDLGNAVLSLERARRVAGSSTDVDANLALARSRQLDQVVGTSSEEGFIQRLANATAQWALGSAFFSSWGLGFVALLLSRLLPGSQRPIVRLLAAFVLLVSVTCGTLLAAHAYVREAFTEGVVMAKTLPAREFPRDVGKVSFEIHSGLKVRLFEASGKYVRIRLPNGLEGWADRDGISTI